MIQKNVSFIFYLRAFKGPEVLEVLREKGAPSVSQVFLAARASLAPEAQRCSTELWSIVISNYGICLHYKLSTVNVFCQTTTNLFPGHE